MQRVEHRVDKLLDRHSGIEIEPPRGVVTIDCQFGVGIGLPTPDFGSLMAGGNPGAVYSVTVNHLTYLQACHLVDAIAAEGLRELGA